MNEQVYEPNNPIVTVTRYGVYGTNSDIALESYGDIRKKQLILNNIPEHNPLAVSLCLLQSRKCRKPRPGYL